MASISTTRSGCDNLRTSTVVLAGRPTPEIIVPDIDMLEEIVDVGDEVVVLTRSFRVAPAASSAFFRFSPTCLI